MSKATVKILEDDLRRLLDERDHLRKQVAKLQARATKLLLENRALRGVES